MFDTLRSAGITTILWDVGGVIVDWAPDFHLVDEVLGSTPADHDALTSALTRHRDTYDEKLTGAEFWTELASAIDRGPLSDDEVERLCEIDAVEWCTLKPHTIDLVSELKDAGFTLGILSNAPKYFADVCRAAPWAPLFDHMTFSWEEKMIKPDPRLYRACLEKMGCEAGEVLFFDDRQVNVDAAQEVGMHARVFTSADQARAVLTSRIEAWE